MGKLTYILSTQILHISIKKTMPKDTKNNQASKQGQNKKQKLPDLEDFFTIYLSKKNRNLEKKLKHISELQAQIADKNSDKKTLTDQQQVLVAKKPENEKQIAENDEIKQAYLEA